MCALEAGAGSIGMHRLVDKYPNRQVSDMRNLQNDIWDTHSSPVIVKHREMKLTKAAELVETRIEETQTYYSFAETHWRRIRTNNPLERIMREIRRRTNVVGTFPDGESALMLCAARLRHIAGTAWGTRRYQHFRIKARENWYESADQTQADLDEFWPSTTSSAPTRAID